MKTLILLIPKTLIILILLSSCAVYKPIKKRAKRQISPTRMNCMMSLLKLSKIKNVDDAIKGCSYVGKKQE